MNGRWQRSFTCLTLVLAGCVSSGEHRAPPSSLIPFVEVGRSPDTFKGQTVTFGGKVLTAKRLAEGTRLEILQLPLDSSLKPTHDLSKSQGRFLAIKKEFLDPATIPAGTFVTITGEVTGAVTMPLDETEYRYLTLAIATLRVWPAEEDRPARLRPYPYYVMPGPYWGPYWYPYWWGPWPYW
ncbi:MAG: Slp family lipoprotein [Nitrospira sp.]|nr:Slp family lipoprotein [Nitrospira sp.]MCP9464355.1 Slp family lipoprotein [Nitrospira sp.]